MSGDFQAQRVCFTKLLAGHARKATYLVYRLMVVPSGRHECNQILNVIRRYRFSSSPVIKETFNAGLSGGLKSEDYNVQLYKKSNKPLLLPVPFENFYI
jgi:hypothetical protein